MSKGNDADDDADEYRVRWKRHVERFNHLRPNLTEEQEDVLDDTIDQLDRLVFAAGENLEEGDR